MMRGIAMLAGMLLLAGCSSTPTRFYTLTSVPAAAVVPGPPLTPPIEVGQITLPDTLDRDAIVIRGVGDQLDVRGEQVWGGPIDEMIRSTLSNDLTARLPPGSVLPPGDPGTSAGVRVLVVNIQQFEGNTAGRVVLAAEWTLFGNNSLTAPPPSPVSIEMKAASGTVADIVPVMSRAMGALADRIAQGLGG